MDKKKVIQKLFNDKEKIIRGYKKVHPLIDVGGANVVSVTSGVRIDIVDRDDNILTKLSYQQAMYYASEGNK